MKLCLARYIAAYGETVDWVIEPRGLIKKAMLTFVAKFSWMLVPHRVSPTKADNVITSDREVMVAPLVTRLEIDFARIIFNGDT